MESLLRELVLSPRLTSSDTRRPTTQTRVNKVVRTRQVVTTSLTPPPLTTVITPWSATPLLSVKTVSVVPQSHSSQDVPGLLYQLQHQLQRPALLP